MDNYEQKYKKALEAVKFLQEVNPSDEGIQNWVKDNFPELKESEDGENKRISKEITQFLKQNNGWNREWLAWLEKQGHMLDPDKVIEWLNHRELSCDDVVTTVIPDDSPTSVRHRVKWLSDEFIEQFKKDFGL